jgi:hypothetical protein
MSEPVELYCTQDEDTGEWLVWFPHPLGGMNVLESFDNEAEAREFWQDQLDTADYSECDFDDEDEEDGEE